MKKLMKIVVTFIIVSFTASAVVALFVGSLLMCTYIGGLILGAGPGSNLLGTVMWVVLMFSAVLTGVLSQ